MIQQLKEWLREGDFTKVRKELEPLRSADIADCMLEMEPKEVLLVFSLLPHHSSRYLCIIDLLRTCEPIVVAISALRLSKYSSGYNRDGGFSSETICLFPLFVYLCQRNPSNALYKCPSGGIGRRASFRY